jgi:hypothetical protein
MRNQAFKGPKRLTASMFLICSADRVPALFTLCFTPVHRIPTRWPVAFKGNPFHPTTLRIVVMDGVMLDGAVVPEN